MAQWQRPVEVFLVVAAFAGLGYWGYTAYVANQNQPPAPPDLQTNPTGTEVARNAGSDIQADQQLTDYVDFYGTDTDTTLQQLGENIAQSTTGIGLLFAQPASSGDFSVS